MSFSGVALTEVFHAFSGDNFFECVDLLLIKPEDSLNPLFKAVLDSVSWVRKLVNNMLRCCAVGAVESVQSL